jgi:hypothetical protein
LPLQGLDLPADGKRSLGLRWFPRFGLHSRLMVAASLRAGVCREE